ncbi:hypothetical protein A20C1_09554 [marine actinobacterium PHSC20C1]|nr:hypothetical protein A20C1_09554 [marine actinobacterium PHSC20C1]
MVDTKMTKSAGEHWVASVLARHGWGVALTRDGLERTDLLAVHTSERRPMIEVQVKTANYVGGTTNWPLTTKSQQPELSTREWFVMVIMPSSPVEIPRSFIVPRNHVAAAAWLAHMDWLTAPDAGPGKRNVGPNRSRVNAEAWAWYEDRWDLLLAPTTECPVMLPKWMQEASLLDRVARNPDYSWQHPWQENPPVWG